ncbi:Type II secretion system protein G precursor [Stieleria neptunia]|uniref:Type II secretion system protein G n=1 Tax=Stieleria neptunia TaxID=2527979 RepID=A0A518HPT7_9BACT|nr:prepilin-type N-terminal cleavage/methylation domain-containing protein [Stieleria neptunia]QDV42859.1 Type II secretion system protein G precursor [Stieleria neptunia]
MTRDRKHPRQAFSLIEVIVTMTILAVLLTFAAPSVVQTMEQSHADLAGASLRSIASAQRFYWLENRTYATTLQELIDDELVDNELLNASPRYQFSITAADAAGFTAQARRRTFNGAGNPVFNGAWSGDFQIDETGEITGDVEGRFNPVLGESPTISPGF